MPIRFYCPTCEDTGTLAYYRDLDGALNMENANLEDLTFEIRSDPVIKVKVHENSGERFEFLNMPLWLQNIRKQIGLIIQRIVGQEGTVSDDLSCPNCGCNVGAIEG